MGGGAIVSEQGHGVSFRRVGLELPVGGWNGKFKVSTVQLRLSSLPEVSF